MRNDTDDTIGWALHVTGFQVKKESMQFYIGRIFALRMICVWVLAWAGGCGNPHGCVKVSGTVTLNGENPPGPGVVTFTVIEPAEGFPNRPTMAKFDTDGAYQATTYDPGDGLLPGSYMIAIECYETPPNMDGKPVSSYISDKYISPQTSGFELTVDPNSKPIRFDIPLAD